MNVVKNEDKEVKKVERRSFMCTKSIQIIFKKKLMKKKKEKKKHLS
jgi:hypothetical protein